ncbi:uncharacterized protein LOC114741852 isoform X2 [Neltuma alba]|uniref:uncharacterized protein LOC114741852 isoform X2 n=1 Tax=Neltuma alba TaxID=207710 RepID=UPI0010A51A73|nr:uncharacterized protein LOC114741852 isoform X2 [Prosopis alba]
MGSEGPYDEERLRNEVIYLHSLWHQGPPTPPSPRPFYIPNNARPYSLIHQWSVNLKPRPLNPFVSNHPRPLQPVDSSTFKNTERKKKKKKPIKKRDIRKRTRLDPHMNSGAEWPMPTQHSAPLVSGWPPLEPCSSQATRPLSAEEKEKLEALQVQYKARQACREFLVDYDDSDDDVEDDEDDMDDDDEVEEIGKFFSKLFGENDELRNYYEKCWEEGEFRCLVCGVADNKNAGKSFHDCVGLVQHSMSISRTKNQRAHRAFGNAVCNVLGWDINRLPTIVIKNEVKPAQGEGKTNDNAADGKDGSLSSDKLDDEVSVEQLGEPVKQDVEVVHETIKRVGELWAPAQDSAPVVSGWPPLEFHPTQEMHPLSAEEKEILEVLQVQYKARQACCEFLFGSDDSDDDGAYDDIDDDVDDMDDDDELEEMGEFFLKLFGENNELRKYYEKCWEGGEFRCLVCGVADNKNAGKRFHDCVGLVRHSMSISRTKNKRAHRAFGNAVCNVLGWDINRLPTIAIKNEVEPAEAKGKTNENDGDGKDGSLSSNELHYKAPVEQHGEPVRQGVEVVDETIKQGEPDKSADDQVNRASNQSSKEDHDAHH